MNGGYDESCEPIGNRSCASVCCNSGRLCGGAVFHADMVKIKVEFTLPAGGRLYYSSYSGNKPQGVR